MLILFNFQVFVFFLQNNKNYSYVCISTLLLIFYLSNFYPLKESVVLPSSTIRTFLFWVLIYILFLVFPKLIQFYFNFSFCECILTVRLPVCIVSNCDLLLYCSLFIVSFYCSLVYNILLYSFQLSEDISLCFYITCFISLFLLLLQAQ